MFYVMKLIVNCLHMHMVEHVAGWAQVQGGPKRQRTVLGSAASRQKAHLAFGHTWLNTSLAGRRFWWLTRQCTTCTLGSSILASMRTRKSSLASCRH